MSGRRCGECNFFSADTKGIDRVWKGPCIFKGTRTTEKSAACDSWLRKGSPSRVIAEVWHKQFGDK